jgi:hypothetical protein
VDFSVIFPMNALIVLSIVLAANSFPLQSTDDCRGHENNIPICTDSPTLVRKIENASLYVAGVLSRNSYLTEQVLEMTLFTSCICGVLHVSVGTLMAKLLVI